MANRFLWAYSSSSSSGAARLVTMFGSVFNFPSVQSGQSKVVIRKVYGPVLDTAANGRRIAAMEEENTICRDDLVPASAFLPTFLLSDVNFENAIAIVPTDENGTYAITTEDVEAYLLAEALVEVESTDEEIPTVFRLLGQLQVRALIVKGEGDDREAAAIQSSIYLRQQVHFRAFKNQAKIIRF